MMRLIVKKLVGTLVLVFGAMIPEVEAENRCVGLAAGMLGAMVAATIGVAAYADQAPFDASEYDKQECSIQGQSAVIDYKMPVNTGTSVQLKDIGKTFVICENGKFIVTTAAQFHQFITDDPISSAKLTTIFAQYGNDALGTFKASEPDGGYILSASNESENENLRFFSARWNALSPSPADHVDKSLWSPSRMDLEPNRLASFSAPNRNIIGGVVLSDINCCLDSNISRCKTILAMNSLGGPTVQSISYKDNKGHLGQTYFAPFDYTTESYSGQTVRKYVSLAGKLPGNLSTDKTETIYVLQKGDKFFISHSNPGEQLEVVKTTPINLVYLTDSDNKSHPLCSISKNRAFLRSRLLNPPGTLPATQTESISMN